MNIIHEGQIGDDIGYQAKGLNFSFALAKVVLDTNNRKPLK